MSLVSVLMPCRNGEPFVEAAVRSILSQEDVDLELVFVDNGSTDTSRRTVLEIGDPRVRVVSGPGTGIADAVNTGLPLLRGDVFARCDADDLFVPGRLAQQSQWLAQHPEFDAVCGKFEMIDRKGDAVAVLGSDTAEEVTQELSSGITRTSCNAWMFRTDVVRKLGGCRPYFVVGEDIDLMLRFAPHHRVWYQPKVWYRYRVHEGTAVHSVADIRRRFLEDQARLFLTQRLETGMDDVQRGTAQPVPQTSDTRLFFARDQILQVLLGRAWSEHRRGQKLKAVKTGLRAVLMKPTSLATWRNVAALALKKPQNGS